MIDERKCKVLLLIGNKIWNWNTVVDFKKSKLNIVGVCVYDNSFFGLPISSIWKNFKKKGILVVIDQILGRILYKIINFISDKNRLKKIFDIEKCNDIKNKIEEPIYFTKSYNNQKTLSWIAKLNPDIIIVHSDGWVGKTLRNMSKLKLIIGGHPGITPVYRGAHSPFWAIYNGEQHKIGFSIFHVDEGVDTGDLIYQKQINTIENESYMSISWRAMKEISKKQVEIIEKFQEDNKVFRKKHEKITQESEYSIPGLTHYIRYLKIQKNVK